MQEPQAGSHAHEAGYDAYMTGAAFACLMRLYEAAASSPGQAVPSAQQQPSLDAVQHLLGRINVGRCAAASSSNVHLRCQVPGHICALFMLPSIPNVHARQMHAFS